MRVCAEYEAALRVAANTVVMLEVTDHVSDDDIMDIAAQHPGWRVERVDGLVVMTPPTGWNTGRRNRLLARLIDEFAQREGFEVIDSSTGVRLPNADLLSADAALVRAERAVPYEREEGIAAIVPDVVIEIMSPRDRGRQGPKAKCERWVSQGVGYVVLLDPFAQTETVWGKAPEHFPDLTPVLTLIGDSADRGRPSA